MFTNFSAELKKQIGIWCEITWKQRYLQIIFLSSFNIKENHVFIEEKDNLSEKVIIAEEELDCVDMDGIGNVENLPRLVLIDKECENCNVVADGGKLTGNINKKKETVVLQAYRCRLCDKC